LKEKVKVFICGASNTSLYSGPWIDLSSLGPPGQVAAIAGKKAGMQQGELSGVLKELGYTEDQVTFFVLLGNHLSSDLHA